MQGSKLLKPHFLERGATVTFKAFVSSTFEDLKAHRGQVIAALRKAGFFVDPMEDWTAAAEAPAHVSQGRLLGCDLCVLLVARRRGFVPPGETRSITQMEYDAARGLGIDVLVFLLDEEAQWPRRFDEFCVDPEIKVWRRVLKEQVVVGFFGSDPDSIEIGPALTRWVAQQERTRVVPPASAELSPELARYLYERALKTPSPFKFSALRTSPETLHGLVRRNLERVIHDYLNETLGGASPVILSAPYGTEQWRRQEAENQRWVARGERVKELVTWVLTQVPDAPLGE